MPKSRQPLRATFIDFTLVLMLYGIIAGPFGIWSGLFTLNPTIDGLWRVALIALVVPSVLEELVFRGPLLALETARARFWGAATLLALFVVWHPVNAMLFLPAAQPLFFDPRFLFLAFGLGLGATLLTFRSGRLWPAILFHWICVVAWKGAFGCPALFGSAG